MKVKASKQKVDIKNVLKLYEYTATMHIQKEKNNQVFVIFQIPALLVCLSCKFYFLLSRLCLTSFFDWFYLLLIYTSCKCFVLFPSGLKKKIPLYSILKLLHPRDGAITSKRKDTWANQKPEGKVEKAQ